ncbi:MAG: hypothetical protein H0U37_01820, partial [Chloroflexi bacterium]|nr:hypothetical protein [Chloroflexota bacterium]
MTASQRIRLIVALGVVNLVLATAGLGIGGIAIQQQAARSAAPDGVIAEVPTPG